MAEVLKTDVGFFIPRELISDFERAEVDLSNPREITIRSAPPRRALDEVLARIDCRREKIFESSGLLEDSITLLREGRERELR